MATLTDLLDFIIGGSSAKKLEEHFGIRTVNDLLRHYPRKYSDGMTVRGEGEDLDLEEGEHVTFVDVITETKTGDMKPQLDKKTKKLKRRKWLRVTLGHRRPNVTATFFNANWMIDKLPVRTRLMLSGEVEYFKGSMQLTHPAFLVLESPSGKEIGTKSLKTIASTSGATGDELLSAFEREFFPIYPASAKVQSWDIYACVRQVLDMLDPIEEPLPESFLRKRSLISEDQALRAIHLAENEAERDRACERLTYDEAIGLQWGLVARRYGEANESGPPAPPKDGGLAATLVQRLPF